METEFTPLLSLAGGVLIGLAATLFMAVYGRIAGMTGLLSALLPPFGANLRSSYAFLAGAIAAPAVALLLGYDIPFAVPVSTPTFLIGGLLVGLGTYFGAGCTSGHGVCGIARLSPRSIVATCIFMASALVTTYVMRHVIGG